MVGTSPGRQRWGNQTRSSLPRSSFITISLAPADAVLRARDASAEASSEADAVLRARDTSAVDWESQTSSWERFAASRLNPRPTVVAPQRQPPGVLVEARAHAPSHDDDHREAAEAELDGFAQNSTAAADLGGVDVDAPFLQSIRCTLKPLESRLTGSTMTTPKPLRFLRRQRCRCSRCSNGGSTPCCRWLRSLTSKPRWEFRSQRAASKSSSANGGRGRPALSAEVRVLPPSWDNLSSRS